MKNDPSDAAAPPLFDDVVSAKRRLRAQGRTARDALGEAQRAIACAAIGARLRQLFEAAPCEAVFAYLATQGEANVDDFIVWLLERGVRVWAPRGNDFAPLESLDAVRMGRWGLREPEALPAGPAIEIAAPGASRRTSAFADGISRHGVRAGGHSAEPATPGAAISIAGHQALILVPGLVFDRHGGRIGFGGGWYDRALARFPQARKVGVAFDEQIVDEVPHEAHDVTMDTVVTPSTTVVGCKLQVAS